jgi:alpha-D-ribose 1-methylphosphonate 5-triphosphate synthase subunit PhnH
MHVPTATVQLRPALDPIHATQATFRVLLEALSEPGAWHQVPARAEGAPGNPWLTAVLLTLLDHETSFAALCDDATEEFVRARTKARHASAADADFVLAPSASLTPETVLALRRGSLAYPDDSATLVIETAPQTSAPNLTLRRPHLTLRGPGIPDVIRADAGLSDEIVRALETANGDYPCGVEVLLIDAGGRVLGLPRSTRFGER